MEPDLPGVVAREVAGVWEGEEEARAGWEAAVLAPALAASAFALIAEPGCPIR